MHGDLLELEPAQGLPEDLPPALGPDEAVIEGERCLGCGGPYAHAPCTIACPADIDVSSFVGDIARGEDTRAARTIFERNLLGGTCGRVCPVEILCEGLGWRHTPRIGARVSQLAVETRFWALFEVVEGRYRLTHTPPERVPIEEWLKLQGRFAHLMGPEHEAEVREIQRRVDEDWDALVARCAPA